MVKRVLSGYAKAFANICSIIILLYENCIPELGGFEVTSSQNMKPFHTMTLERMITTRDWEYRELWFNFKR